MKIKNIILIALPQLLCLLGACIYYLFYIIFGRFIFAEYIVFSVVFAIIGIAIQYIKLKESNNGTN